MAIKLQRKLEKEELKDIKQYQPIALPMKGGITLYVLTAPYCTRPLVDFKALANQYFKALEIKEREMCM